MNSDCYFLFKAMSVYSTISKSQESGKKAAPFKKIVPPKPKDDFAEYFSDEEDLKKHKANLQIESVKTKNTKL